MNEQEENQEKSQSDYHLAMINSRCRGCTIKCLLCHGMLSSWRRQDYEQMLRQFYMRCEDDKIASKIELKDW